jgi:hypothetical protein
MNLAKRTRKITIDANNKRNSSNSRDGAADASSIPDRDQQRRKYAKETDLQDDRSCGDRVKHAASRIQVSSRDQRENREGSCYVHEGD